MNFTPRPYQQAAIDSAVRFFKSEPEHNAFQILPTGAGKSIVIANVIAAMQDSGQTLVFQPKKEILEQNFKKYRSYGFRAGIYSASCGSKFVDDTTFATIGSVIRKKHLFQRVRRILVDECHDVAEDRGMYNEFFSCFPDVPVLGFTATPFRLASTSEGPQLQFINRTTPRIFEECNYYVQTKELFDAGHLAKLKYIDANIVDRTRIRLNSKGDDFNQDSLKAYMREVNMPVNIIDNANEILRDCKSLLIFCSSIDDCYRCALGIPGSKVLTGETSLAERAAILKEFTSGKLRCLLNVGVLTTGFDYPELEAMMLGHSTMSLALYYQEIGRVMRPHENKKEGVVVDLGGNINLFGRIEAMEIRVSDKGLHSMWNTDKNRQLTNVPFSRN